MACEPMLCLATAMGLLRIGLRFAIYTHLGGCMVIEENRRRLTAGVWCMQPADKSGGSLMCMS